MVASMYMLFKQNTRKDLIKMSKTRVKQIYLLIVGIIGIIAIILYSTYAIFTLEGETSNIVSIHTPNSLQIPEDIYEYRQIIVPKNSVVTTDIDLYNANETELCYSVWYKVIGSNIDKSLVKVYENNQDNLTTSGIIPSLDSKRISLIITNDLDTDVKVNLGSSSSIKQTECIMNINEDKSLVSKTVDSYQKLSDYIISNVDKPIDSASSYLTYKNQTESITLNQDKIYISSDYSYQDELFTLNDPKEISSNEIKTYLTNSQDKYYTCLDKTTCLSLYQINSISEEEQESYSIINYDLLVGYQKTTSGIKKITQNNLTNYLYYGDNPNNFIYFNCQNEQDVNTCELWQIIGSYYDEKSQAYFTKIIRSKSIGLFSYNDKPINDFYTSSLYNYLNKKYQIHNSNYLLEVPSKENYLNNLNTTIDKINFKNNIVNTKVSIINLTDYLLASSCPINSAIQTYDENCLNNNWLNKNDYLANWTNTIKYVEPIIDSDEFAIPEENNNVYTTSLTEENISTKLNVRPVVYLKDRVLLSSGDGSLENPFVIR